MTPSPKVRAVEVPTGRLARLQWAITDGMTLTRRNLHRMLRAPEEVILGFSVPIMLVLVFGYVFGNAMAVGEGDYIQYFMPGMFVMTVVMSVGATASGMALDVHKGVMDRFRSMPVARSAQLTGRGTADMLKAVPEVGIMIGCGLLVGWRVEAGLDGALAAVGLLLLLRLALEWMGIYLGLIVTNPDLAGMVVYPLVFPLTALSTAFVPAEAMPSWLAAIASWNPLTATVDATRQLLGSPVTTAPSWVSESATLMALLWPLVLTAIFMPLSIRRYRRMSR